VLEVGPNQALTALLHLADVEGRKGYKILGLGKTHQNHQNHQKMSKNIKNHQNTSKHIKTHQNTSKHIKTHQNIKNISKTSKTYQKHHKNIYSFYISTYFYYPCNNNT
jgi:hypothetical protein